MKRVIFEMALLALVAGFASCQKLEGTGKEIEKENTMVEMGYVTLNVSIPKTRVDYTEINSNLNPTWKVGDVIVGYWAEGESGNRYFSLTVDSVNGKDGSATISGTAPINGDVCLLYKTGVKNLSSTSLDISYKNQSGGNDLTPNVLLSSGTITEGSGSFEFASAGAVIGISNAKGLTAGATVNCVKVYGKNLSNACVAVNGNEFKLTASSKSNDVISTVALNGITVGTDSDRTLNKPIYIAVPAGAEVTKVSIISGKGLYSYSLNSSKTVEANKYLYVKTAKEFVKENPEGSLPGVFSVGADKQVFFSQGNLQATYNKSTSTYSWGFAANQYDYIADAPGNTTISNQVDGAKVDLFGWSAVNSKYGLIVRAYNDDFKGAFVEWGKNIDNSGTWYTPSVEEWCYLFGMIIQKPDQWDEKLFPAESTVRTENKYKLDVKVNGKIGLVIAPDDFDGTIASSYTSDAWATAESVYGLVFLPSAGYYNLDPDASFNCEGFEEVGCYWSSTGRSSNGVSAFYLQICIDEAVNVNEFEDRDCGQSVRLVSACK